MGDRVSISFKKGSEESVALFSHWDGLGLVSAAEDYVETLPKGGATTYPLDRREPETVMVDFIRHLTHNIERVKSNYYLGSDQNEGDNSDNGHHIISLD